MTPYYADEFVTLYHGDTREILPALDGRFESVITDPVWPNAPESIPGHDEHEALMREVSDLLIGRADRLVIQIGSQCDPRWLSNVRAVWPFLAVQQLDYAMPAFRGRVMLCDVACACGDTTPINGRIENLKHTNKARRKEYPDGQSLAEVWERYGNCCVVCGAPKDFLDRIGWTRERHHVMAYVDHEHAGPIVPMCGPCHHNTTQRQKLFWFWYRRELSAHGESVSGRSTAVSQHGAASDSVPAAAKDPHRQLEGFSDRAANQ